MNQDRRDMLEAVTQDLDILAERYNYAHKGINMAIVALKDEPITKLMELHEIVEKYWQGLISYYDALEKIIDHRYFGASIVSIDDSIKAIQKGAYHV